MGFEWLPPKNYKRHYICLECQKGFKRSSKKDMKNPESEDFSNLMNEYYLSFNHEDIVKYINVKYQKLEVICPNCQNKMLQVHYDFEVPRQRDTKSWKILQKKLFPKTILNYDRYIQWHHLALQKVAKNSEERKMLKQNLAKLERKSSDV